MALLPDADIQRLKTEISLLRLIESQGHVVTRQGKDAAIRCPFHEGDDTPSLVISPASNLFHCFACEAAGSVIDWVMKTRGVSFRFACEILQSNAGLVTDQRSGADYHLPARLRQSHARLPVTGKEPRCRCSPRWVPAEFCVVDLVCATSAPHPFAIRSPTVDQTVDPMLACHRETHTPCQS